MKIGTDTITFTSEKTAEKLHGIPGLKVFANGLARGSIDAIAAGALALGSKRIPKPHSPWGEAWKKLPDNLRDYQKKGADWLVDTLAIHRGAILADDMGLGKTLQVLTAIDVLLTDKRVLVLCPAAALETWRDELKKWGVKSFAILTSEQTKAAKSDWLGSGSRQWVVCSYDHRMVRRAMEVAFARETPIFLVLDEAHRLRGRDSKRSETLEEVRPLVEYAIAMTATPQFNRPRDLWQLLRILFGYRFGSKWDFDKRYCGAYPGKWGGLEYPKKGSFNADELRLRLSYYLLRREKSEVAHELPPLTFQVRWVEATSEAKKAFIQAQAGIGKITLHDALIATLKGKVQESIDLAVEAKRFVMATWLKEHARQLHKMLNQDYDTPCELITGEMPVGKRAEAVRRAQAAGHGIVATTDSISESLNLQHVASVGILHALDWTPLKLAQLFARIHRLGSVDPVTWYLVAMRNSVDQVIIETQVAKLDQYRANFKSTKGIREFRHALADEKAIEQAEKQALKEIYAAMEAA